jgi:hypothetical protein
LGKAKYYSGVNELHEVKSWEQLGQWCWVRMLALKQSWRSALPLRGDLPSAQFEESIDSCVKLMLLRPGASLGAREEAKPWILARLQFCSGLLQPCNLRRLRMPRLIDPENALWFLLLTEWHESGREFWPVVCDAIAEPINAESCAASLLI